MDAFSPCSNNNHTLIAEIMEGLREYQMILVDSAGKCSDSETAVSLYKLATEHAELEVELRDLTREHPAGDAPEVSAFLNQIRALGRRLKGYGDFSRSQYILCEVIQTEDRMIRRFTVLIDQISDLKWKRRLVRQLDRLLEVRNNLSRFSKCETGADRRMPSNPRISTPQ